MAQLESAEIRALARIVDELDYYQLMHLERTATAAQLKKAYHSSSRNFHPDANRSSDPQIQKDCVRISKRLTEAYCVLRDPRRRKAYAERQGKTPQGRQYVSKATTDLQRGDYASAVNNLQMALTFERGNPLFEEKLEEAKRLKKEAADA